MKAPKVSFDKYLQNVFKAGNRSGNGNQIISYFPEADLRCSHLGLSLLADKQGVSTKNLALGEFIVFMNKHKDKMKIFTAGNVLVYQKSFEGSRLDPRIIALIPKYFTGGKLDYSAAVKELIEKDLR